MGTVTAGVRARAISPRLPRPHALERWSGEVDSGIRKNDMASFDGLAGAGANEDAGLKAEALGKRYEAEWFYESALLRLHD